MSYSPPHWIIEGAEAGKVECVETLAFCEQYAPMLEDMGRLSLLDTPAFTRMAIAWGMMMRCLQIVSYEGPVVQATERGKQVEKRHPASMIADKQEETIRRGFAEFGMTPLARKALHASAGSDADTPDNPAHSRGLLD